MPGASITAAYERRRGAYDISPMRKRRRKSDERWGSGSAASSRPACMEIKRRETNFAAHPVAWHLARRSVLLSLISGSGDSLVSAYFLSHLSVDTCLVLWPYSPVRAWRRSWPRAGDVHLAETRARQGNYGEINGRELS